MKLEASSSSLYLDESGESGNNCSLFQGRNGKKMSTLLLHFCSAPAKYFPTRGLHTDHLCYALWTAASKMRNQAVCAKDVWPKSTGKIIYMVKSGVFRDPEVGLGHI